METETAAFTLMELFRMGGAIMWPLLAYSITVITIGLERVIYFISQKLRIDDLGKKVSELLAKHDYEGAKDYLSALAEKRPGARVLLALVERSITTQGMAFAERKTEIEQAAESEAMDCIKSLEKGFNFLVALGSLSPLTGFLGTVTGMIGAFRSIAEAAEVNAQIVAGGIYEALITTVFGLIVAIIAMVFHSIFTHIVDNFASETEKTCSNLIIKAAGQQ